MKKSFTVSIFLLLSVHLFAANPVGTRTGNALFMDLQRDLEIRQMENSRQGMLNNPDNRIIRTDNPSETPDLVIHPRGTFKTGKNKGAFYYFGAKIGTHAFNLKYLGYVFYALAVAAKVSAAGQESNNNEYEPPNQNTDNGCSFGGPYDNPFQLGFRGAYFFKGKYGFVFDVEYNSFEFSETVGVVQFKSLQYIGVNFIPSFLIKRKLSFGIGVYANFLISSRNNLSLNLAGIREYVSWIDFGLIASLQFYIDFTLKIFFGLEFKLGFADRRNMPYQSTETNRNMGFFFNLGFGF